MVINLNIKDNVITFEFKKDDPFDIQILEKAQDAFSKLNPKEEVVVHVMGIIPIEISAYLIEVANHCKMILTIYDDDKCFIFMQQLLISMNASSTMKIDFKGEKSGE